MYKKNITLNGGHSSETCVTIWNEIMSSEATNKMSKHFVHVKLTIEKIWCCKIESIISNRPYQATESINLLRIHVEKIHATLHYLLSFLVWTYTTHSRYFNYFKLQREVKNSTHTAAILVHGKFSICNDSAPSCACTHWYNPLLYLRIFQYIKSLLPLSLKTAT